MDAVNPTLLPAFLKKIHLFGRMDDALLATLAEQMQSRSVEQGQHVYELGADSVNFYFLYQGKVRLFRDISEEDTYDGMLSPGDYFGLESISGEPYYVTDAVAEEDSIVVYLSGEQLDLLTQDLPELRDRLDLEVRSFNLMWNNSLKWREPGEMIYYYTRRHIVSMLLRMIFPFILAMIALFLFLVWLVGLQRTLLLPALGSGLAMLVALAWGVWSYFDWANDYFVITDRRVLVFEKVILMFDSRQETPLEAVLAVDLRTTWLGRILGFGDVKVKSFTGTIGMDYVEATNEVQQMIEYLLLRARQRKSNEAMRTIAQTIRTRLGRDRQTAAARTDGTPATVQEKVQMTALQRQIATFLNLRIEEGGAITYRKHWFILLKQTWAPTLILLGLLLLMILRIANVFPIASVGGVILTALFLGFFIFLWWGYEYWDWTNDVYVITSEQLVDVDKRPLGTETRKAAPLKNILSIEYQRQGIIGNLLNFGTVFIKVGETTFTFDYVHDPRRVQRELFNRYSEVKDRERKAEEQADHKRMADWIEEYDRQRREMGEA